MDKNTLGARGESLFQVIITQFIEGKKDYIFKPCFLGDKWENVDFIVELRGISNKKYYFFVQVKTTRSGYTKKENKLKVIIPKEDVIGLAQISAPTYIIGIDDKEEKAYIVSANGELNTAINHLPTNYPLNTHNLQKLWQEVKDYWDKAQIGLNFSSNFSINNGN
jgi:hypothetical protein